MTGMMVLFGVILFTSVLCGALSSSSRPSPEPTLPSGRAQLYRLMGFEALDAVLVGVGLLVVGRPPRWPRLGAVPQVWLWAAGVAGVVVLVALNAGYHHVLRAYLGGAIRRDPIVTGVGITPLVILTYCVEPAVVEELFFRYLALDTLRSVMGVHAAVVVSSIMFGMAHIGVPLSIPILAFVGFALAYARVTTGRLALPMLLHCLHNGIVLLAG